MENLRVSFESIIIAESIGSGEIDVIVSIMQADGSVKSVIFNAISLALMDAGVNQLVTLPTQMFLSSFLSLRHPDEGLHSLLLSCQSQ